MVDFIQTRISGTPVQTPSRKARDRQQQAESDRSVYAPPYRARMNEIPQPSVMESLIDRALEALKNGVYWDRGTILNVVL